MRGDLDMVEDIRVKKENKILNKYLPVKVIGFLIFLIICGLSFNSIFIVSTKTVKQIDEKMEQLNKDNKNSTRKTYYIEQKILKDLEMMMKDKK
jgi:Fe2+ transport system protein B